MTSGPNAGVAASAPAAHHSPRALPGHPLSEGAQGRPVAERGRSSFPIAFAFPLNLENI